ncbi:MAG: hydantoinase/oxoprolinase family protein [Alphaproteobacteria bacterium]|nr:hydantoinase/oxoprolinase family protein [Alphaproteobacteria bacterium]
MTAIAANAGWRIGIDVGGTFTDFVLTNAEGAIRVLKVPSVPTDPARGVMNGLGLAAEMLGLSLGELLARCAILVHGSTIATNTLLEKKGATVGMLTTRGFRDSLEIRRGIRENPWDHRTPYPEVLVPRYLRLPVSGRFDRQGREVEPLNEADIHTALATFREEGVDSIAICLINSFLDPAHERRAAEVVRENWNGRWLSVSAEITPIMGEYERGSTAAMNAYVAPRTVGYLLALDAELGKQGLPQRMLLIQNNGGAIPVAQVATKPVTLLLSGPAAGVGTLEYFSRAIGSDNLISMEIGGTSCDVILMSEGRVAVSDQLTVAGYHLAVPSVEVHTIGAGGGTIAGVDEGGLLFVGPRGAGASPGPAAYGLGGADPTSTDAQLVLGRMKPGPYAGGSVTLDGAKARAAVAEKVARPLGIDVEAAAAGMIRLLEQNLLHAVQRISIERGHDPRRFTLVACGGAGPMHGATVGRMLGCRRVYVPRLSGVFCALGMLHSNVRHDFMRVYLDRLAEAEPKAIERVFAELETQANAALTTDGFAAADRRLTRQIDLRYIAQQFDVRVTLDSANQDPAAIRAAFEHEHDRLFGHHQPGGIVEITKLRVVGIGILPPLPHAEAAPAVADSRAVERRRCYLDAARGFAEVPVHAGASLAPGHRLQGPLLIEELTTTVFVNAGDSLEVDASGNFLIHLAPA